MISYVIVIRYHLTLIIMLQGKYNHLHFMNEETETHKV